jgi:hypothetical protein
VVFKQPYTRCTGNAANQKLGFLAALNRRNEGLLYQRMIQLSEPIKLGVCKLARCDRGFCAELIKAGQPFVVNGLTNGLAALATEKSSLPIKLKRNKRLTVSRLAAMEAI